MIEKGKKIIIIIKKGWLRLLARWHEKVREAIA